MSDAGLPDESADAADVRTVQEALGALARGETFDEDAAHTLMSAIMTGAAGPTRLAALLMGLRVRGETVSEITGFARAMREHSLRIDVRPADARYRLTDTCGTGGAPFKTFNVSTASAFVVAGAGVPVAKHGNRSVTSPSGSADVLEALGADLSLAPEVVAEVVRRAGVGFLFAPTFHPAMRHAIPARKALGVRTVFNVLGPLTNPAGAEAQVIGVFDPALTRPLAEVLGRLGVEEAMVVHGDGGLDEVSTLGPTRIAHLVDGRVTEHELDVADHGIERADAGAIGGLAPRESAKELRRILDTGTGARADLVLVNAACAIQVSGAASDYGDALGMARESIASGAAMARLDAYLRATRELAAAAPERTPGATPEARQDG